MREYFPWAPHAVWFSLTNSYQTYITILLESVIEMPVNAKFSNPFARAWKAAKLEKRIMVITRVWIWIWSKQKQPDSKKISSGCQEKL